MRILWACTAYFLWRLLILVPVAITPMVYRTEAYLLGLILGTAIVLYFDRRSFPDTEGVESSPYRAKHLMYALVAGIGFAILGKELGNIGLSIAELPTPLEAETAANVSPLLVALLSSVVYPSCFMIILLSVSGRALLSTLPLVAAMVITVLIGAIGAPLPVLARVAFVIALPVWLFARSHSLSLSIAAHIPATALPLLDAIGCAPGVRGFDVESPERVLFQPVWFNVLGAVLIAAGVGPMLRTLANAESEGS